MRLSHGVTLAALNRAFCPSIGNRGPPQLGSRHPVLTGAPAVGAVRLSARNHRNPNVRPGYSPGSDAWKTTRSMMSRRWPALPKAISTPRSRVLIKSAAA